MMIPCVSCDSMFQIDDIYIKSKGSKVRCSKCRDIFFVFPPDQNTESCPQNSNSIDNAAIVIPNVRHSLLDDLFQVQHIPAKMATPMVKNQKRDHFSFESIGPKEDSNEGEEAENIEYAELPDLSEIEEIVDSILDEGDHLKNISPYIQANYSLSQDLNFSEA